MRVSRVCGVRLLAAVALGLGGAEGSVPRLRAWHPVSDLRATSHGTSVHTTALSGETVHVREWLTLAFRAKGRQHTLNLTRASTFPEDATVTLIRPDGQRAPDRRAPLLPTYFAHDASGRVLATGTLHRNGAVRALVRDGKDILIVEPAFDARTELPAGVARPREGEPFAYNVADAHISFDGDDEHQEHELRHAMLGVKRQNGAEDGLIALGDADHDVPQRSLVKSSAPRQHRALATLSGCPNSMKRLVLGVAIDQLFVEQAGSADKALVELADIISTTNAVYKDQLNLELSVDRVYIFQGNALDDTLPPSYPAVSGTLRQCTNGTDAEIDSSELLEAMRLWSKDHAQSSDKRTIWHLLSGCFDFVNSVAGKAYVKVACTQADGRNVGYSSRLTAALTWLVVAHELGHNLGGEHTSDGLMKESLNATATQFSTASASEICPTLNDLDTGSCLPDAITTPAPAQAVVAFVPPSPPPSPPSPPPPKKKSPPSPPPPIDVVEEVKDTARLTFNAFLKLVVAWVSTPLGQWVVIGVCGFLLLSFLVCLVRRCCRTKHEPVERAEAPNGPWPSAAEAHTTTSGGVARRFSRGCSVSSFKSSTTVGSDRRGSGMLPSSTTTTHGNVRGRAPSLTREHDLTSV